MPAEIRSWEKRSGGHEVLATRTYGLDSICGVLRASLAMLSTHVPSFAVTQELLVGRSFP